MTKEFSLELLGARVLTLTAEVRDLQHRFTAMESRFSALESRFTAMEAHLGGIESRLGVMEDRMSSMLSLIIRIAERPTEEVHNSNSPSRSVAPRGRLEPRRHGASEVHKKLC